MPVNAGIHIEGFTELNRNLAKLRPDLVKEFRRELLDVGQDIVHEAQAHVPVRTGRALNSMRAGADQKGAYVQGGKSTVPYYAWLDFGGVLRPSGNRRNTQVRDFRKDGRYLYPAIEKHRSQIEARATDAFDKAKAKNDL